MITVGGGTVVTPALTRAIREFGEQAKKQLEEKGSLAGFEGKFTDDSSGGGSVSLSISALGAAAYDASASKNDTLLAFTLTTAQPDGGGGTATSLSSGSSEIIHGEQDIDTFTARFQGATDTIHFGSFVYGTPEELAAANDSVPAAAGTDAGGKASDGAPTQLFAKLQQQESASKQLIDLLQGFLDSLGSKRNGTQAGAAKPADTGGSDANAIRTRLAQFIGTDVTT